MYKEHIVCELVYPKDVEEGEIGIITFVYHKKFKEAKEAMLYAKILGKKNPDRDYNVISVF